MPEIPTLSICEQEIRAFLGKIPRFPRLVCHGAHIALTNDAWHAVSTVPCFGSVAVVTHPDGKQLGKEGFFGLQSQVTVHQHTFLTHSLEPSQSNCIAHIQGGPLHLS